MPQISLSTLRSLVNFLTKKGIAHELLLQQISLTVNQLENSQDLIDCQKYEALFTLAESSLAIKNIGFEFGQQIAADRWGILGYIAFTAPTLKTALACQVKYQSLAGSIGTPLTNIEPTPVTKTNNKYAILKWLPSYHCSRHTVEEIITGWISLARKLSSEPITPKAIYFSHSDNGNIECYQTFFNCQVFFNSDFNGVKIANDSLQKKLNRYDAQLHQLLCGQADKMLNNLIEQLPVKIITEYISHHLAHGVPEIEQVAKNLQISIRTLQRKLSDNQQTFTNLIEQIRQQKAINYLQNTDTKIITIAQMLGFSEQSAFQRAFKRWTGETPKQCRENKIVR